jgi:hypothetical protein
VRLKGIAAMKPPVVSESEAQKASRKGTWKPGWYPSYIVDAREKVSNAGNDCFELTHLVRNAAGDERSIRDWLVATNRGLLKLKHAIEAVGASGKYNAGEEITEGDFADNNVEVRLGIEKKRSFDRPIIEDYRAAASPVVNLRSVAKVLVLLGGVSLAALTSGCAGGVDPFNAYPRGGGPQSSYVDPNRYLDYVRQYQDAPANYAVNRQAPVAAPSPSWQHDLGTMANGAAIGAVGGMVAGRAMAGREAGQQVANRALPNEAARVAEREAARVAESRAAAMTAERVGAGVAERAVIGRAAGAAAVAAGVVEADALLDGLLLLLLF